MNAPDSVVRDFIQVGGSQLEIKRIAGAGVPILMLHEGLGSVTMWKRFPEKLAAATGRPVIIWSRQGYGWSSPLTGARDVSYMHTEAGLVFDLMDVLEIERACLFGHSDGASIALIAAGLFPDRVESLVLEAPHVFVEPLTTRNIEAAKTLFQTTDLAARMGRYHSDPAASFWGWNDIWLSPPFRNWNIEDGLRTVRAPVLSIQGVEDEYGTVQQLDRIEAQLPLARRLMIDNCRHSPHRDQEKIVLDATAHFLSEVT